MFLLFPNLTQKEVRHIRGSWKEFWEGKGRWIASSRLIPTVQQRVEDGNELLRCWNMRFQNTERYGQKILSWLLWHYDSRRPCRYTDTPSKALPARRGGQGWGWWSYQNQVWKGKTNRTMRVIEKKGSVMGRPLNQNHQYRQNDKSSERTNLWPLPKPTD